MARRRPRYGRATGRKTEGTRGWTPAPGEKKKDPRKSLFPEVFGALGTFSFAEIDPPSSRPGAVCTGYLMRAAVPTGGYGGWSRVARPRKKALTEWVGRDSMSIEIPFLFDAYTDPMENPGLWIEDQIRSLERMAGIDAGDPEPPLIEVTSNPEKLIPHNEKRAGHVDWFVESITWDPELTIVNNVGNRLRAGGTCVITQYVKDEKLETSATKNRKKKTNKNSKGGTRKTYVIRPGDTLPKIAARKEVYGDPKEWKKIAKANKIRDPRLGGGKDGAKGKMVGKELKIP
jgi:hypothetical protein